MWPFASEPSKAELTGHKTVKVNGFKFVIRRVSPLLDFDPQNMPQVFTAYQSRRKKGEETQPTTQDAAKAVRDMYAVVQAGLVEPKLVPVGKAEQRGSEDGITVEDLFRDLATGPQLYWEIMAHSLNRFRGIRGVFFSMRQRLSLLMLSPADMDSALRQSSSGAS